MSYWHICVPCGLVLLCSVSKHFPVGVRIAESYQLGCETVADELKATGVARPGADLEAVTDAVRHRCFLPGSESNDPLSWARVGALAAKYMRRVAHVASASVPLFDSAMTFHVAQRADAGRTTRVRARSSSLAKDDGTGDRDQSRVRKRGDFVHSEMNMATVEQTKVITEVVEKLYDAQVLEAHAVRNVLVPGNDAEHGQESGDGGLIGVASMEEYDEEEADTHEQDEPGSGEDGSARPIGPPDGVATAQPIASAVIGSVGDEERERLAHIHHDVATDEDGQLMVDASHRSEADVDNVRWRAAVDMWRVIIDPDSFLGTVNRAFSLSQLVMENVVGMKVGSCTTTQKVHTRGAPIVSITDDVEPDAGTRAPHKQATVAPANCVQLFVKKVPGTRRGAASAASDGAQAPSATDAPTPFSASRLREVMDLAKARGLVTQHGFLQITYERWKRWSHIIRRDRMVHDGADVSPPVGS